MMWIRNAWRWSRTVLINALSLIAAGLSEFFAYAIGANWASVIDNPRLLFWWLMILNAINIALRLDTRGPVGSKK